METAKQVLLQARAILDGQEVWPSTPDGFKKLVKQLKNYKEFGLARQLLAHYRKAHPSDDDVWLVQQHALCTYKDEELLSEHSLEEALTILANGSRLDQSTDSETLALAGAIHKRRWEISGARSILEQAIFFYECAFSHGQSKVGEWTYAAINAAYLSDLLAKEITSPFKEVNHGTSILAMGLPQAQRLRDNARECRQKVIDAQQELLTTANNGWWGYATLAEAHMGLRHYPHAKALLEEGLRCKTPDWEKESTARQLAAIALMHEEESGPVAHHGVTALEVVQVLTGSAEAACALTMGKVGLAFSGGGFRAALFHVGMLAFLAERDLLRWVEVLSCVSGGSILGALYYLELRKRLNTKKSLSQSDYIDIVKRVEMILSSALEKDIRTRATFMVALGLGGLLLLLVAMLFLCFLPWGAVILTMFVLLAWVLIRSYSTVTEKLGALLEERLFTKTGEGETEPVSMALRDLRITPFDPPETGKHGAIPKPLTPSDIPAEKSFHPRRNNWNRRDKVPVLILNATTLNTGHNWQFTASWMGEAPSCIEAEVDSTERLRRFYIHDTFSLGKAVAASACVPLPFPPITLPSYYDGRKVRLVDGGVDDNQGIFGLLEQGCTILLVSDGSGQLQTEAKPSLWTNKVVIRANDILMQSVRRGLFRILDNRRRSGRIKELLFVHMQQGLWEEDVTMTKERPMPFDPPAPNPEINPAVQKALAQIRTDLDAFSPNERNSLMYAGYVMAQKAFDNLPHTPLRDLMKPTVVPWNFFCVKPLAERQGEISPQDTYLLELLRGHRQFFRWFRAWFNWS